MKHSRMRRRSLTNSRPWENLELYERYGQRLGYPDELLWAFPDGIVPIGGKSMIQPKGKSALATDRHHIGGGILGSRRWDKWTNLIALCRWTHLFCGRFKREGFALCACTKIRNCEWDRDDMAQIIGVASTIGWLDPERGFEFPWINDVIEPYLERI